MVDWNQVSGGDVEKLPSLNGEMKEVGNKKIVTFLDDGKLISAEIMERASKAKGLNIKSGGSHVFTVVDKGIKKSFWVKETSHSVVREMKNVASPNNNTLVGLAVEISRVSKSMTETNWGFRKA